MKRGIIIEDLPDAQAWLSKVLTLAFPDIQVSVVNCVEDAKSSIRASKYDIALVDIHLPDGSGIDVITYMSKHSPHTYAVVTTIYDDDQYLFPALRAGAKGYLLKEQSLESLAQLLKNIMDGQPPLSPSVSQRLLNYFAVGNSSEGEIQDLTKREREVLIVIAKGYSLTEAAQQLNISRSTIATHVKNIYSKLAISSRAEAAMIAAKTGLISPDQE